MDNKSPGVDFDRQPFVNSSGQAPRPATNVGVFVLFGLALVGLCFWGYKTLAQSSPSLNSSDGKAVLQLRQEVTQLQGRLDELERMRKHYIDLAKKEDKNSAAAPASNLDPARPSRIVYRVSPSRAETRTVVSRDPAAAQRIAGLQQGLTSLQTDTSANREAWQATADRLADVTGQVGTQQVTELRNQDELNELITRTRRTAIPFELRRGSAPEMIGPASLQLRNSNPKNHRYTLCVYVQQSCVELKNRTLFEVVQFVNSRNASPLEVIATRVGKDELLGYLEVPSEQVNH
ncbi:MAG: hypothetical protein ACRD4S_03925 [Candidatus Acidiferrales bacterium]